MVAFIIGGLLALWAMNSTVGSFVVSFLILAVAFGVGYIVFLAFGVTGAIYYAIACIAAVIIGAFI